jgi:hypothetical protein
VSPRLRPRVDTTHPEIVLALRQVGASVQSLASVGKGCPDLLVGYRMRWYVLEAKTPGGTLTPDECAFIQAARAEVHVVDSVESALRAIGAIAGGAVPAATRGERS